MRGTAASPWSRRPSWTPRARSSGWRGCEQAAGADRPRPADRDRPRAVRGLRRLRQGGAGRVRIGRRVGRPLPRPGGGRARAAAARVRCLPRGRDRGVGRDRPPDRPRESQPKPPVVTGLRLVIPRDPWPRLRSERATRVAIATIYAMVLLVALAEVARSLGRAGRLDYGGRPLPVHGAALRRQPAARTDQRAAAVSLSVRLRLVPRAAADRRRPRARTGGEPQGGAGAAAGLPGVQAPLAGARLDRRISRAPQPRHSDRPFRARGSGGAMAGVAGRGGCGDGAAGRAPPEPGAAFGVEAAAYGRGRRPQPDRLCARGVANDRCGATLLARRGVCRVGPDVRVPGQLARSAGPAFCRRVRRLLGGDDPGVPARVGGAFCYAGRTGRRGVGRAAAATARRAREAVALGTVVGLIRLPHAQRVRIRGLGVEPTARVVFRDHAGGGAARGAGSVGLADTPTPRRLDLPGSGGPPTLPPPRSQTSGLFGGCPA